MEHYFSSTNCVGGGSWQPHSSDVLLVGGWRISGLLQHDLPSVQAVAWQRASMGGSQPPLSYFPRCAPNSRSNFVLRRISWSACRKLSSGNGLLIGLEVVLPLRFRTFRPLRYLLSRCKHPQDFAYPLRLARCARNYRFAQLSGIPISSTDSATVTAQRRWQLCMLTDASGSPASSLMMSDQA
jgi:hypothetical protein